MSSSTREERVRAVEALREAVSASQACYDAHAAVSQVLRLEKSAPMDAARRQRLAAVDIELVDLMQECEVRVRAAQKLLIEGAD